MKVPFFILNTLFLIFLVSCASGPRLYPNQKYKSTSEKVHQRDIDECMSEAEKHLKSSSAKRVGRGAGQGAAIGAAIGAVGGLFSGNLGRGVVQGGAMGAAGGSAAAATSPDQLKRNFVNQCLSEKGYQVVGWD